MKQPAGVQLGTIAEEKPLTNQQQGIQNLVPTQAQKSGPNLAKRYLLEGIFLYPFLLAAIHP